MTRHEAQGEARDTSPAAGCNCSALFRVHRGAWPPRELPSGSRGSDSRCLYTCSLHMDMEFYNGPRTRASEHVTLEDVKFQAPGALEYLMTQRGALTMATLSGSARALRSSTLIDARPASGWLPGRTFIWVSELSSNSNGVSGC